MLNSFVAGNQEYMYHAVAATGYCWLLQLLLAADHALLLQACVLTEHIFHTPKHVYTVPLASCDPTRKWKLTHILVTFPTPVIQEIIAILLYRSNRTLKLVTLRTGFPFALLGNRSSPSIFDSVPIFDFHKTLDLPVEMTFPASSSTSEVVANIPLPTPTISTPCTFALVHVGAVLEEQNTTLIKEVSASSIPFPFPSFQELLMLITTEIC